MEAYQTEAFWKELAARRRTEEKKWNRASLVLGLGKLALVVTVFLTVYFLWLRGDAALGASLTATSQPGKAFSWVLMSEIRSLLACTTRLQTCQLVCMEILRSYG